MLGLRALFGNNLAATHQVEFPEDFLNFLVLVLDPHKLASEADMLLWRQSRHEGALLRGQPQEIVFGVSKRLLKVNSEGTNATVVHVVLTRYRSQNG